MTRRATPPGTLVLLPLLALTLGGCRGAPPVPSAEEAGIRTLDPVLEACDPARSVDVRVDTVATGLEVPWDAAFLPDGRALVTERPGRIRVISADGTLEAEPWATFAVARRGEVGLLGITHRTRSDGTVEVYVAAVADHTGGPAPIRILKGIGRRLVRVFDRFRGQAYTLEVLRVAVDPVTGRPAGAWERLVEVTPMGILHGGGALRFSPDGLLHLTNGDGGTPPEARDPRSGGGKVLRYTADGTPAPLHPDDPVPAVLRGLRNSQGIAWHPDSGDFVVIDHGPTGLPQEGYRVGDDELNIIGAGADLGWPMVAGATEGGEVTSPVVEWTPSIAPAGLEVAADPDHGWGRSVFVTGLRGAVRRLPLGPPGSSSVLCQQPILSGVAGRLRLVRLAPDGSLWIGTSNRDGRGGPRPGDDRILRLRPAGPPVAAAGQDAGPGAPNVEY